MKRLIMAVAGIALIIGAGAAEAKSSAKSSKHHSQGFVSRNVRMDTGAPPGYHANADFRYGPQIDYPWSPPGGGS